MIRFATRTLTFLMSIISTSTEPALEPACSVNLP
jgi:hypothetical protein